MICAQREESGNQDVTQRLSRVSLMSPGPTPVFFRGLGSGHLCPPLIRQMSFMLGGGSMESLNIPECG